MKFRRSYKKNACTAPGAIDFAEFGRRLSIILIMFENFEYYIKNCFLVLGSNI